jgi:single-strand DNA-binding protein
MASNSTVTIVGNLTRDPELRFTPSGQATASFGVAVNRSWQNRQTQEWNEVTSFFDVVCWAALAENAAQSLTRGTRVVVSGRLEQRSWENQDGEKRSKIEIVADEVAPSLRFATAQISRNERRGPDGQGGGGGGGGGTYNGGGSGGGGGYSAGQQGGPVAARPAGNDAPPADYQYEEEPF